MKLTIAALLSCLLSSTNLSAQPPSCSHTTSHYPIYPQSTVVDTQARNLRVYVNNAKSTQYGYFQVVGPNNQWIGAHATPHGDGSWYADIDLQQFGTLSGTFTLVPWIANDSHGGILQPCGAPTVNRMAKQSVYGIRTGVNYNWS